MKKIPDTDRLYATKDGKIYSDKLKRYRKLSKTAQGYLTVGGMLVHRLIWRAFRDVIPYKYHINHLDGVKTNNNLKNLECVTHKDNIQHYIKFLGGYKKSNRKLSDKDVEEIRKRIKSGETLKSISKDFPVTDRALSRITRKNPASYKEHTGTFLRPLRKEICLRKRGRSWIVWHNVDGKQQIIGSSVDLLGLHDKVCKVLENSQNTIWDLEKYNSAKSLYRRKNI